MKAYRAIDPRMKNIALRKTIQIIEKEVTEIDPALLEIDQLRSQIERMSNEIQKIEAQWKEGIEKAGDLQLTFKNKGEVEVAIQELDRLGVLEKEVQKKE